MSRRKDPIMGAPCGTIVCDVNFTAGHNRAKERITLGGGVGLDDEGWLSYKGE